MELRKPTEDQKKHLKVVNEAQRNNNYISLTWQLFNNYLARYEDNPQKALELAQAAIEVWKTFEDGNYMEYPEEMVRVASETPAFDFSGEMIRVAPILAEAFQKGKIKNMEEEMRKLGTEIDEIG